MSTKTFTRAEVATHNKLEDMYIVISNEVYDITDFQHKHPGGNKILKIMAGKDATKPFRKNHNERILKSFQYKHLCIGVLADEPVPSDGKTPGRFSRMMSWKKGERSVREVEVNVKEVVMEEKPSVQMVEMTGLAEVKSADPRLEGRGTMDVLAKDLAIVAL